MGYRKQLAAKKAMSVTKTSLTKTYPLHRDRRLVITLHERYGRFKIN